MGTNQWLWSRRSATIPSPGSVLPAAKALGLWAQVGWGQFWIPKKSPPKDFQQKILWKIQFIYLYKSTSWLEVLKKFELIDVGKKILPWLFQPVRQTDCISRGIFLCWNLRRCAMRVRSMGFRFPTNSAIFMGISSILCWFPPPPLPKKRERGWLFAKFCFSTRWFKSWLFHPLVGDHLTFARITFSPSQKDHKDLPGRYILKISYLDLKAWNIFGWGKVFLSDSYSLMLQDVSPFAMCI